MSTLPTAHALPGFPDARPAPSSGQSSAGHARPATPGQVAPTGAPARTRSQPDAQRWQRTGRHGTRIALSLALPLTLLLAWTLVTRAGLMPPQILPSPSRVWQTLVEMLASGEIVANLAISAQRIALGFGAGCALALPIGVWLGVSPRARAYLEPTLKAIFTVPTIGWIPILILIFGIDEALKILVIAKAVMVPVVINTSRGIQGISVRYFEVADVLRLGRRTRLFKLILPASLPAVFSGLRLGIGNAFIALIVVEMLAATEGIGYMMVWGRKLFQLDVVLVGILVVGLVGLVLDLGLKRLERRIGQWETAHG